MIGLGVKQNVDMPWTDDTIGKEHFLYKLGIGKRIRCPFLNEEIALRVQPPT